MRYSILCLGSFFLMLSACKGSRSLQQIEKVDCSNISILKELIISDPATILIDTVYVNADELHTQVRVKGCNSADNVHLAWNGAVMKSYPPRVSLKLLATKEGENALLSSFHRCFNLKTLRQGEGSGKVYIGLDGSDQKLLYEY